MKKESRNSWKKYIIVLLLTIGIFLLAFTLSTYFNEKKISELRSIQDKVATDLLSSETQVDFIQGDSCTLRTESGLSDDLAQLAEKISYSESNVDGSEAEIVMLKKQYSILEVKDYVLNKRIGEKCNQKPAIIFYFYSTKDKCPDCVRQGYVLDAIRADYPQVRVYSFDFDLDLSIIRALRNIYNITEPLPAVVVDGMTLSGFQSYDAIATTLPPAPTPVQETGEIQSVN